MSDDAGSPADRPGADDPLGGRSLRDRGSVPERADPAGELFHGAVTGAVADNAGGYAALTLAPPDREVLTVEYKVNFLAPAYGEKLVARGEVLTAGRRLFVCKAEVFAVADGESRACAASLQTVSLSPVRA